MEKGMLKIDAACNGQSVFKLTLSCLPAAMAGQRDADNVGGALRVGHIHHDDS